MRYCSILILSIFVMSCTSSDWHTNNVEFVDALNQAPNGQSYYNWFNNKSGNSGIIKISRSYIHNGFKCSDYSSTVNITDPYPMDKIQRSVEFGTACQLPDGRWQVIKAVSYTHLTLPTTPYV